MPAEAADHQHVVRPDRRIGLDRLFRLRDELGLLLLAAEVLVVQLLRQSARFALHRVAGREQQPGRDVRRTHPPGGVDARRDHEGDLIAVDRLAGEPRRVEQRAQSDGVRTEAERRQPEPRDHPVLANQRDDVGQRADGGNLDERRQPLRLAGAGAECLHQLQCHTDARQVLVRVGAVVPLRVDHRERRRQRRVGLVMVRDDQIDPELARPPRGIGATNAAVHRDDERDAICVEAIDRGRLQPIAILQAFRE